MKRALFFLLLLSLPDFAQNQGSIPESQSLDALAAIESNIDKPDAMLQHSVSIKKIGDANPFIYKSDVMIAKVRKVFEKFISAYDCGFELIEPEGELYSIGGFDKPLALTLRCSQPLKGKKISVRLASEKTIRFQADGKESKEISLGLTQDIPAEFSIMKTDMVPERNKFQIIPNPDLSEIYSLFRNFGMEIKNQPAFVSSLYKLKRSPEYSNPGHKLHSTIFPAAKVAGLINGREMEAVLTENGIFTIGSNRKGQAMDLTFGHPNDVAVDGLWSSFLSIRVNGKNYKFNLLKNIKIISSQSLPEITAEAEIPEEKLTVSLTLRIIPGESEKLKITLSALNQGEKKSSVGFRILLDTWAGEDDGVPFTIPGAYGDESYIHQKEVKFNPITSPVWETLDADDSGFVLIRNNMVGDGLTPPDELAFVNWGAAFPSEWEYDVDDSLILSGDSAVLEWWKPKQIGKGEKFEINTEYTAFQRKKGIYFVMDNPVNSFGYLYLQKLNDTATQKEVEYFLSLENGNILNHYSNDNKVKFKIKPSEILNRVLPVTLTGFGESILIVKEKFQNSERVFKIPVSLPKKDRGVTSPVWSSDKKYPVQYISEDGNLKIKGRLRDTKSGKLLGEVSLVPNKVGLNYIYSGEIKVDPSFSGEVDIEIFE
ncbi:MAG: hypothetical protein K8R21_09700 [Leptospira sp.]|nr:hypothetical protein [Leptospira sp.]